MVSKMALYGLGGAGGVLLLMAMIKKKKKSFPGMGTSQTGIAGPKQYHAVAGDKSTPVAARFGVPFSRLVSYAKETGGRILMGTGRVINLPPGVADTGARPGAMGKVT